MSEIVSEMSRNPDSLTLVKDNHLYIDLYAKN